MKFELDTTDGRARRGRLVFDRGVVETPAFSVTVFSSSIFYWQNILLRVKLHSCPPIASGSCS